MKKIINASVIATFLIFAGCTSRPYEVAKVSGVVKMDGQPLSNATVVFRPMSGSGSESVKKPTGPQSIGKTDQEGRFELKTVFQDKGAAVGKHQVTISTLQLEEDAFDPENPVKQRLVSAERVPWRYNLRSELSYEVTSVGSDAANFELQSR